MAMSRISSIKNTKKGLVPKTPFQQLIADKKPWGKYSGSSYLNNVLNDESGNNRHAICNGVSLITSPAGNGNTVPNVCVSGISSSTIVWPSGSIPSTYTICCLTRYNNNQSMGRLLNGHVNDNFNFGAYRGSSATWYDGAKEGCSRSLPFGNLNW